MALFATLETAYVNKSTHKVIQVINGTLYSLFFVNRIKLINQTSTKSGAFCKNNKWIKLSPNVRNNLLLPVDSFCLTHNLFLWEKHGTFVTCHGHIANPGPAVTIKKLAIGRIMHGKFSREQLATAGPIP